MQCSKCGYVLGELDTECLRCRRAGGGAPPIARPGTAQVSSPLPAPAMSAPAASVPVVEEKECPRCGKATGIAASLCDKCGYEYRPEESRAERYQALLAEESRAAAPPSALQRTIPPYVSWSLIGVCLVAVLGASYAMLATPLIGRSDFQDSMDSPVIALRHPKPHRPAPLQSVTYKVTGTATQATVTYRGADAAAVSPPAPVPLPWTEAVKLKPGSALSLSAKPTDAGGTVQTEIDVDGAARKQSGTPGADGATSVTDTL